MKNESIRVIVADDHSMVRSGLRLFLMAFDDMLLVGEAANGMEAVRLCEQVQPDIVLMDLIMPVQDGIRATQEMARRFPKVRVIGLTSFLEPDLLQEAVHAGMAGLLSKDISASELVQAIRDVHAGRHAYSEEVIRLLDAAAPASPAPTLPEFDLTNREVEVLALMVSGKSNADIAKQLVVSLSTAKYHVSSILEKLHVSSRAEAISLALQYHLVEAHLPPTDQER